MNFAPRHLFSASRSLQRRFSRPPSGRGRQASTFGGARPVGDALADLRSATRMLRHEKRFVALVVFTLALGLGSTAAVFGMADQLLLRPLPGVRDEGRAAYLRLHAAGEAATGVERDLTTPEFDELRRAATLLDGIASYNVATFPASVGDIHGIRADVALIYGDYFEVLGVRPSAGQLLRAADTQLGTDPMRAVISERMAAGLFGSAAGAIGKTIRLNSQPMTVIGVAGSGFSGAERNAGVDVWLPWGASASLWGSADSFDKIWGRSGAPHGFFIVRPRRGVSVDAVRGQLRAILQRLAHAGLGDESERRLANVEPTLTRGLGIPPELRPTIESALHLLAGVVALVLLIACANVANLLLFRNVARRRLVTTQRALGASPGRIAREHLVQSLVLGVLGATAGLGVGWLISFAFRGQTLGSGPAFEGLPLDHRVAIFAALASVVTALLFGTLPAALAGRFDLASALRQTGVQHTAGRVATFRSALAAGQLALTLTLGVGALLLVRTVHNLNTAGTGLDFHSVAFMWQSHRLNMTRGEADALARRMLAAVESVPGVQGAALGPSDLDPHPGARAMARVGPPGAPDDARIDARIVPVTPGWFRIFRVPTANGRVFSEDDWKEGPPYSVVLTASLARKLFGTETAVGRTLDGAGHTSAGVFSRPELHVIGVVQNLSGNRSPGVPKDAVFVTYAFRPVTGSFSLVIRTRTFDAQMAQHIRAAISDVLPNELVDEPTPISAASAHREQETLSRLLVLLSALAATLAAVGLYGVIAFVVAGRRRELAVRIALGAEAWRIARLVARFAAVIVGTGTALGLGGAYLMSRGLQGQLFGVSPLDPASYVVGATLLGVVAAVACAIPAWRAVRVDPMATLREE